jgi:hypothetical protein
LVVVVRVKLVCVWLKTTVALGISAPLVSVTLPNAVAVESCPKAAVHAAHSDIRQHAVRRNFDMVEPPHE